MVFKQQVTTDVFLQDGFYALCVLGVFLGVAALALVDAGLGRRTAVLDAWVQKLVAGFVTAFGFSLAGYGVWQWQYNQAFGIPHPFKEALSTWWLGGSGFTHFASALDPRVVPGADVLQVFGVFFLGFAFFLGAAIHTAGIERLRAGVLYPLCFVVGALVWPFLAYLTFGSASPLTNAGLHDYVGVFPLYLFVGALSVMMAWRLGPRAGAFGPDAGGARRVPADRTQVPLGVLLLLFAYPLFFLGSGFIEAGQGYFGITMSTSGFGLALVNVFMAYTGGTIGGAVVGYLRRDFLWVVGGPIMGAISVGTIADVGKPWQMLLISLFAPASGLLVVTLLKRARIDDSKLGVFFLGPSVYGVLVSGFVAHGVAQGGFFGLRGKYAFQGAHVSVGMQLVGLLVVVGFAVAVGALLWLMPRRRLRVTPETERTGLDATYWPVPGELPAEAS